VNKAAGAVPGEDGLARCPWGMSAPEYIAYHDEEWGRPVRDDGGLYERLCLEAFQSGLSWLTILRKREGFRRAFDGFAIEKVASYSPADVARLLADGSIVRNRAKIEAAIANAKAALGLPAGLGAVVWRYADPDAPAPQTLADVPATTPGSTALAKELKKSGFRFVGPTTAYALMQACGLVDDHLAGCFRRGAHALPR
jgi:DNA-3-methyladenine glycosylase I